MVHRGPDLTQQLAYYEARAREYDEWFLRKGRYDRGPEATQAWFDEVDQVRSRIRERLHGSAVVEFAAGTGNWTPQLLEQFDSVTVVDGSSAMLDVHRAKVPNPRVDRIEADLFDWEPPQRFDAVFFGFWLSHVPRERVEEFFTLVERSLNPGGRFFLVDSLYAQESTARDHELRDRDSDVQERRLNDGRSFEIVKVFYTPEDLAKRLEPIGWQTDLHATDRFFVYGDGVRSESIQS